MAKKEIKYDTLIALIPSKRDLDIAFNERWYRIPTKTKRIPLIVKDKTLKFIAFYQPKIFKEEAFLIRWYGKVKRISIVKRNILLPSEIINKKSDDLYYKIGFNKLRSLKEPIYSRRRRRILFINSTYEKLLKAKEINDLFIESPLEETMWIALKNNNLYAERQYLETIKSKNFFLDFALFCRKSKLALECDGDTYHTKIQDVKNDKNRDNILKSRGWNVLRYTTEDIYYKLNESVLQVKETIQYYGGLEDQPNIPVNSYTSYYEENKQDTLF